MRTVRQVVGRIGDKSRKFLVYPFYCKGDCNYCMMFKQSLIFSQEAELERTATLEKEESSFLGQRPTCDPWARSGLKKGLIRPVEV